LLLHDANRCIAELAVNSSHRAEAILHAVNNRHKRPTA
jgi:hypothetical protein